jgi:hypothetical protein
MDEPMTALTDGTTGWRMGVRDGHYVDVVVQSYQTRIVLQPVDAPPRSYKYYWCYKGEHATLRAVAAANVYVKHATDDDPVGFDQSWRKNLPSA